MKRKVAKGVECWQLDRSVDIVISKNVLEAWNEVTKVLVEKTFHIARHVWYDAASQLHALMLLRLERILYKTGNLIHVNVFSKARHTMAKALKCNQTTFCYTICLPKKTDDQLNNIITDARIHSFTDTRKLNLQKTTKEIL